MDPSTFGVADKFVDEISDAVDSVLVSEQLAGVRMSSIL
jgi:hypothetical protein